MTNTVTFLSSVGGDNSVVTDDSNATTGLGNGGHKLRFVPALAQTVAVAGNTVTKAAEALASANAAAASAASAALSSPASTSTSSLLINTGSKTFTTQANKSYQAGQYVLATSAADPINYMSGNVTSYSGTTLIVNVVSTGGSGTYADWNISISGVVGAAGPASSLTSVYDARTSNTVLSLADTGKLIDITSGTFSQTFSAASTMTNFMGFLRNSGTGSITLDPNGAELIDGLATYIMYPGEVRFIQCNASTFRTFVVTPFNKTFTSSGSFVKPPGYAYFGTRMWSGGASGARNNDIATQVQGGAGGGCGDFLLAASSLGSTETITIGAGGVAVTTVAVGNVGGDTTFGALATVFAGNQYNTGGNIMGASISSTSAVGFEGGQGSGSTGGRAIWGGSAAPTNGVNAGGRTVYGAACGGSLSASAVVGAPGTSIFGGAGGVAVSASSASAGVAPGGGGGATQTGTASGAGAAGMLIVWGVV